MRLNPSPTHWATKKLSIVCYSLLIMGCQGILSQKVMASPAYISATVASSASVETGTEANIAEKPQSDKNAKISKSLPNLRTTKDNLVLIESKQTVNQIIHNKDFSQEIHQTKWVEKNPQPKKTNSLWQRFLEWLERHHQSKKDSSDSDVLFGMFVKLIALLALLGFVIWLIRHRDKWLAWLGNITTGLRPSPKAKLSSIEQQVPTSLWQGLPPKSQLALAIEQALSAQNWQLALSLLYRGTLREVVQIHDLPITKATTEQQCQWLLDQAQYKKTDEAKFFANLVQIWSKTAYGNPTVTQADAPSFSQTIQQLSLEWQQLYVNVPPQSPNLMTKYNAGVA